MLKPLSAASLVLSVFLGGCAGGGATPPVDPQKVYQAAVAAEAVTATLLASAEQATVTAQRAYDAADANGRAAALERLASAQKSEAKARTNDTIALAILAFARAGLPTPASP